MHCLAPILDRRGVIIDLPVDTFDFSNKPLMNAAKTPLLHNDQMWQGLGKSGCYPRNQIVYDVLPDASYCRVGLLPAFNQFRQPTRIVQVAQSTRRAPPWAKQSVTVVTPVFMGYGGKPGLGSMPANRLVATFCAKPSRVAMWRWRWMGEVVCIHAVLRH